MKSLFNIFKEIIAKGLAKIFMYHLNFYLRILPFYFGSRFVGAFRANQQEIESALGESEGEITALAARSTRDGHPTPRTISLN